MLQLLLIPLFAALSLAQNISFINPGPSGPDSEYDTDPSFEYGSNINIQWTPTSATVSLVIYQQTPNAAFEYIFQNQAALSSYSWDIVTSKNLKVSRVFFFELFVEGQTSPAAISHYFNITGDAVTTTTIAQHSTSATSTPTSKTKASATSSTSPTSSPSDGGLSTGAKVGLGVGIPVAVIIGVVAGWFFFGRKRKSQSDTNARPEMQPANSYHGSGTTWYDYHSPQLQGSPHGEDAQPYYMLGYQNEMQGQGSPILKPQELETNRQAAELSSHPYK